MSRSKEEATTDCVRVSIKGLNCFEAKIGQLKVERVDFDGQITQKIYKILS